MYVNILLRFCDVAPQTVQLNVVATGEINS
jgi:hypothetical protein